MSRKIKFLSVLAVLTLVLSVFLGVGTQVPQAQALNNGLALTPPMGWNSWNNFGCNVSDTLIRGMVDAMVSSGMSAAGYKFVNIDDCWQNLGRTNGHVTATSNFPSGIKGVADYAHSKGLKLGVYSDNGTKTCAGREGGYTYETTDANDYAAWGVDYLKYDNCYNAGNYQTNYTNMKNALGASGRAIVFSICAWNYQSWMPATGNLWRTTGDINDSWGSMIGNYDTNVGLASSAGPGAWNDPDMLEIGRGGMSDTQYRTHMSLWAIMASPLIAGNDTRSQTSATSAILEASEIIAVDQDSLGHQGTKVSDNGNLEIISKVINGTNTRAVALLNRGTSASNITVTWSQLGLPAGNATVRDLWAKADLGTYADTYTVNVPAYGTAMLKIVSTGSGPTSTPGPTPTTPPAGTYYRLTARHSGKVAEVSNFSTADGGNVQQWTWTGTTSQQWQFVDAGSGYYNLVNRNSGKCLDVVNNGTADGVNIDQWTCNGGANQKWQWVANGSYFNLKSQVSGKCMDVNGASTADGANIIQWTCGSGTNQQWTRQ